MHQKRHMEFGNGSDKTALIGESMSHKFYVFGAHSRAQTAAFYIQYLYPEASIEAYLVNNEEPNAVSINGVPVIRLEKNTKLHGEYPVFLGTRSVYHENLAKTAGEFGIRNIYPVTAQLDLKLRNAYLRKYFSSIGQGAPYIQRLGRNDAGAEGARFQRASAGRRSICTKSVLSLQYVYYEKRGFE